MTATRHLRVGIFFGGRSAEHAVSVRSAQSVVAALDRDRFLPLLVAIGRDGRWYRHGEATFRALKDDAATGAAEELTPAVRAGRLELLAARTGQPAVLPPDVVFPLVHGPSGEDGTLQGFLETAGVPYVGPGVLGSAACMDKDVQKRLLREAGLPIVPFAVATRESWSAEPDTIRGRATALGDVLFVKPANLGSSVGISRVTRPEDLAAAIEEALRYDFKIVIERGFDAREIECAVLGNMKPQASVPGEILPEADFYSYRAKYAAGSPARLAIPAPLDVELSARIRRLAVSAFQIMECHGMARVDFLLDRKDGGLYVNELNTIPGFTSISMYPKLWEASGIGVPALLSRLIDLALAHAARRGAQRVSP